MKNEKEAFRSCTEDETPLLFEACQRVPDIFSGEPTTFQTHSEGDIGLARVFPAQVCIFGAAIPQAVARSSYILPVPGSSTAQCRPRMTTAPRCVSLVVLNRHARSVQLNRADVQAWQDGKVLDRSTLEV